MNNYYFSLKGELIEVKSPNSKMAVLTFMLEYYNTQDEKCTFKFLGKDFYNRKTKKGNFSKLYSHIHFDDYIFKN